MKFLRGVALGSWVLLMSLCVSLIAAYYILSQTILNPTAMKGWLNDSGVYSSLSDMVVPQIADESQDETVVRLITPDMMQRAAKSSIKPETTKAKIEPIIDAVYAWLDSKSPEVTFSISTKDETRAFLAALKGEVLAKIKALPPCQGFVDTAVLETASCLPSYVSAEEATELVMQRLNEQEVVRSMSLTPEMFDRSGQSAFSSELPDLISYFWVAQLLAMPIVAIIALWLLFKRHGGGLVAIASAILSPGLTLIVLGIVIQFGGAAFIESSVARSEIAEIATPLGKEIAKDLASLTLTTGLVLSGTAGVLGGLGIWWRKRAKVRA